MDIKTENKSAIYEVGYHVAPMISETEIPAYASKIKAIIEENEGKIISEELPRLGALAYEIYSAAGSKKQKFNKTYFGWVKFESNSSLMGKIKKALEGEKEILRFILVKTVRENTIYHPKFSKPKREERETSIERGGEMKEVSEEEIDKSIEALVIA
jgi:ribosomal protein S6